MTLYPAIISTNLAAHSWTTFVELFTKMPSYPAADTILADVDGGDNFNLHVYVTSGGVIAVEAVYHGAYCLLNMTPHLHVDTHAWHWVKVAVGATDGSLTEAPNTTSCYGLVGQVVGPGGYTDGLLGRWAGPGTYSEIINCKVAWGVSINGAFAHQQNQPGRLIAQPRIGIANAAVDGAIIGTVPTADLLCTDIDGLYYPSREPVGPTTTLAELCVGSDFTMDAGPLGCTIVRDSPY